MFGLALPLFMVLWVGALASTRRRSGGDQIRVQLLDLGVMVQSDLIGAFDASRLIWINIDR